ncbi:hypothetical protein GC197_14585 [bacterium]|nr:hypothetical protein [bacterium]
MSMNSVSFNQLKTFLSKIDSRKPIYYVANPGNWGDALIRYGTRKLFSDMGLEVIECLAEERDRLCSHRDPGTVIYGGGGAWCNLWQHAFGYVKSYAKFHDCIVLPSTYDRHFSVPRTTFFCRDQFESKQHMPESTFVHDLAFYIGDEFRSGTPTNRTGYFFRKDAEKSGRIELPQSNVDLSRQGSTDSHVGKFFEILDHCKVIHTDRLHVAIAGCLLHREVHLYPGSYFKNRAVFESSIRGVYSGTFFHEISEAQLRFQ